MGLGEIARKAVHMLGVFTIPLLQQLGPVRTAVLFFALAIGLYIYPSFAEAAQKTPFRRLSEVFRGVLDFLERKDHKRYRGAMHFFASIGLISLVFPTNVVSVAVIVLCIGDGVSTLIGLRFGKNRLFHNKSKSWEGSLSGFIASTAVCLFVTNLPMAAFASFVGMLVESLDAKIDDNISVPFAVSTASSIVVYSGLLAF